MCPRCGALSLCGHPFLHESNPAKPWFRRYALLQVGTQAAPPYFNDRNREDPDNYWPSASSCDYVVTLRDEHGALLDTLGEAAGLCTSWPSPPAGLHTGLLSQVQAVLTCSALPPPLAQLLRATRGCPPGSRWHPCRLWTRPVRRRCSAHSTCLGCLRRTTGGTNTCCCGAKEAAGRSMQQGSEPHRLVACTSFICCSFVPVSLFVFNLLLTD